MFAADHSIKMLLKPNSPSHVNNPNMYLMCLKNLHYNMEGFELGMNKTKTLVDFLLAGMDSKRHGTTIKIQKDFIYVALEIFHHIDPKFITMDQLNVIFSEVINNQHLHKCQWVKNSIVKLLNQLNVLQITDIKLSVCLIMTISIILASQ